MKKLLMLVAAAFVLSSAQAQLNPMEPIPTDKAVRVGKLENGMTYYIRHNEKPKGQAHFYILHDVGSIQEADNQQGLAHFLEHMAFNGTKNLPGKQLINYLETVGVKFGQNLNAGTTWDLTQYELRDVPTARQGVIDTALLILHDWSHFIALQPEEIDSERGVISEELRTRDGAEWRSSINMVRHLAKGTKYEHRNVIGDLEGLKSFSYADITEFYHNWYRPDYQAIAIVGDIDVDQIEASLKKLMSDIPAAAADAPTKEVIIIPNNDEPIVSVFTDPEMMSTSADLFIKRPAMPKEMNNLVVREMNVLMTLYITGMMNERLAEIAQQPDAPFLGAYSYDGSVGIAPTMEATAFSLTTEDGKLAAGFEALLTEMEKVRRNGFTQSEFERMQNDLMRSQERQYNNRNDRRNGEFVTRMLSNFRTNTPIPDAETEWQLDSMLIKMITVADVNMVCPQLIQPQNWVVVANAPAKEGVATPTPEDLLALIAKVQTSEIATYEDNAVTEPLIANTKALKGSPVKTTATNNVLGTTEWTLKNGAKIIVKPTTLKADEVHLAVNSKGGRSILTDEEFYTASLMPGIMQASGIGNFSATDLRKQLSGKTAQASLAISGQNHGVQGYSSPKDIETMLQLLYLSFTSPRFNEDDYNTYMKQVRAQVENMQKNPDYIVQDQVIKTVYNNNLRAQMLSNKLLDGIKYADLKVIHDKLYKAGVHNFTFTFVGNVNMATLKPLVEKYIGSLPTGKQMLNHVDDHINPVKGEVVNDFKAAMQQPKVSVWYYFTGDVPYTIEDQLKMEFLTQILTARYQISIREEKGGTYGVGVQGQASYAPKEDYTILIQFDTNEQMADELREIIRAEINKLAAEGPQTEDVEKVREFMAKQWKNSLEENGGWLDHIEKFYTNKLDYVTNYENILKNLTNEDIQKFAQKILADGNVVNVVMRPEVTAPAEPVAPAELAAPAETK